MKVSVVIPVFNEEKYIKTCLSSLKKQTSSPFETIVVDNNCTDKTIEICRRYSFVTVVKESTQGMIPARNRGFNFTRGDIIARCDADVILPHNWIETIQDMFTHQSIDALTGPAVFYDLPVKNNLPSNTYSALFKKLLKGNDVLLGPNMVITKKIWNEVKDHVCLDDKKVHEDIDLSIHIVQHGGQIKNDKRLTVQLSGRRIKYNPVSFFGEYPIRLVQTLIEHTWLKPLK